MKRFTLLPFFLVLFLLNSCTSKQSKKEDKYELFKDSYKKYAQSAKKLNEHYSEKTGLYVNQDIGFVMKFPFKWKFDWGNSEHTIARWLQEDSAFTISINVVELNLADDEDDVNTVVENDEEVEALLLEGLKNQLNSEIFLFRNEKIWFANHEAMRRSFIYEVKHYDAEYYMQGILIQIYRKSQIFTMGLMIPLDFYIEDPEKFENIFEGFYFGAKI